MQQGRVPSETIQELLGSKIESLALHVQSVVHLAAL